MSTTAHAVGFSFVERLAQDLRDERLELPAFPEAVIRIQRVAAIAGHEDRGRGANPQLRARPRRPPAPHGELGRVPPRGSEHHRSAQSCRPHGLQYGPQRRGRVRDAAAAPQGHLHAGCAGAARGGLGRQPRGLGRVLRDREAVHATESGPGIADGASARARPALHHHAVERRG